MIKAVIFDYNGVLSRNLMRQKTTYRLVKKLEAHSYKTAVLSNMARPIAWVLKKRGDFNGFDEVVISSDVGFTKPDPRIYEIILTRLALRPEECLFIDDLKRNVEGAERLGIKSILAKNTKQLIDDIIKILNASEYE